jgi:molybdopterin-guanine dinucleotide biosynthesis protein A
MQPRIAPYILAGGRSSRMGRDKAMLMLRGKTLLARTVETLRAVPSLNQSQNDGEKEQIRITVVGERTLLEGADRALADEHAGCGPLGGIEVALGDLEQNGYADWALFLPVDMPFLSAGLIDAMLHEWTKALSEGALACYVSVDGIAQPLVSLLHRRLYPHVREAVAAGRLKVTPVLQSVCAALACTSVDEIPCERSAVWQTRFTQTYSSSIDGSWVPTEMQQRTRHLWFSNINTPEDFDLAEDFLLD